MKSAYRLRASRSAAVAQMWLSNDAVECIADYNYAVVIWKLRVQFSGND